MGIGLFKACQKFLSRPAFVANPDVINALQSQSFLPYGYCYPKRPLIVFKSIPVDPGGASGELNRIENDKNIASLCLVKKAGEGSEIWSHTRYDHRNSISR